MTDLSGRSHKGGPHGAAQGPLSFVLFGQREPVSPVTQVCFDGPVTGAAGFFERRHGDVCTASPMALHL